MERKDKIFEIGVVIALIVFFLILLGICLLIDMFVAKKDYTLFLKPYTILKCNKWDCENVSDKLDSYNNEEFNVYLDGKDLGKNTIYYNTANSKFYIFNQLNDNIFNNERSLIYNGGASIVQKKYDFEDIEEEEYSNLKELVNRSFLKENVSKVSFDFNNDNETEKIYVINNNEASMSFNALCYYNNKKYILIDINEDADVYNVGFSYISNILDIFDDGKIEFIYTHSFFDEIGTCNQLYRLKGSKFVKVNECEIVK